MRTGEAGYGEPPGQCTGLRRLGMWGVGGGEGGRRGGQSWKQLCPVFDKVFFFSISVFFSGPKEPVSGRYQNLSLYCKKIWLMIASGRLAEQRAGHARAV